MLKLEIQQKGEEARVEEFAPGEIQIGRVNGNDIVLPKGNISKRHAKIVYANGSATLSDTNSTNGTFLNGERITSNPLSAADKIYLGEFVITVLGLDEDSSESVEIPLDEATATSTPLGEDVLEESSWGGQDDQKEEWNANWEAAEADDDDEFDPLAAATDYSDLEPSNDEVPPDVIVPAAPNVVTRDFDPVETGAIEVDEGILLDEIEVEEPDDLIEASVPEPEPEPEQQPEPEAPTPEVAPPVTSSASLIAQHLFGKGESVDELSDGTMQPSAASLDDVATAHEVSTDAATALSIGEAHVTWLGTDIIDGGQLIVQPATAFAKSLEALRTQGLADSAETILLDQIVSAKLSIAVIGNHGPVRRSVLCALAHHAGAKGSLSVAGLAGPTPEATRVLKTECSDDELHLAMRTLSSDFNVLGSGLAEHQWEGTVALGLAGTMTETALGQSLHLETLYGALSIFDAIIVTGRKGDGSLGIVSIESVETSASGSSTLTAYLASSGKETLADTSLSAKLGV